MEIRGGWWQLGASRARSQSNLASPVLGGRWRVSFLGLAAPLACALPQLYRAQVGGSLGDPS